MGASISSVVVVYCRNNNKMVYSPSAFLYLVCQTADADFGGRPHETVYSWNGDCVTAYRANPSYLTKGPTKSTPSKNTIRVFKFSSLASTPVADLASYPVTFRKPGLERTWSYNGVVVEGSNLDAGTKGCAEIRVARMSRKHSGIRAHGCCTGCWHRWMRMK